VKAASIAGKSLGAAMADVPLATTGTPGRPSTIGI
jgi:hypothetical protein